MDWWCSWWIGRDAGRPRDVFQLVVSIGVSSVGMNAWGDGVYSSGGGGFFGRGEMKWESIQREEEKETEMIEADCISGAFVVKDFGCLITKFGSRFLWKCPRWLRIQDAEIFWKNRSSWSCGQSVKMFEAHVNPFPSADSCLLYCSLFSCNSSFR